MPSFAWLTRIPSLCAVCRGWGDGRVCHACTGRFGVAVPRCRLCALPVPAGASVCGACAVQPPSVDGAVAALAYAFPWDRLLVAYKFHGALDLADTFAGLLRAAVSTGPPPGLVMPVPLSRQRLRERGFNQAWELARRLPYRADAHTLLRVRHTPHQLALPEPRRRANVRGAFAVAPEHRGAVAGRHVAVVDDVMTTGATAAEVASVLREAGAASVRWWVVARTPRPGSG